MYEFRNRKRRKDQDRHCAYGCWSQPKPPGVDLRHPNRTWRSTTDECSMRNLLHFLGVWNFRAYSRIPPFALHIWSIEWRRDPAQIDSPRAGKQCRQISTTAGTSPGARRTLAYVFLDSHITFWTRVSRPRGAEGTISRVCEITSFRSGVPISPIPMTAQGSEV